MGLPRPTRLSESRRSMEPKDQPSRHRYQCGRNRTHWRAAGSPGKNPNFQASNMRLALLKASTDDNLEFFPAIVIPQRVRARFCSSTGGRLT